MVQGEPIHVGTVNGKPFRFYRCPFPGPHMPFHAVDDLFSVVGLPREASRKLRRSLISKFADEVRYVGPDKVTIAPHYTAQAFLEMVVPAGGLASVYDDYVWECGEALNTLVAEIPLPHRIQWVIDAYNRQGEREH